MPLRWLLAIVHLLGFAIGVGSIWVRYRTPIANPTSNAIYSRIGYVTVCDAGLYFLKRNAN